MHTLDLHNHTPLIQNDYRGPMDTSLDEIADAVVAVGIDVFGVTDHFSIENVPAMARALDEAAERAGREVLVVCGSELTVTWRDDESHLIPIFPRDVGPGLCLELFDSFGFNGELADVSRLAWLTVDMDPTVVIDLVHALGGLCIAAHVDRTWGDYRLIGSRMFERIMASGIDAVEVLDESTSAVLAERYPGSRFIRASDAHSVHEIGCRTCRMSLPELSFAGLRAVLGGRSCV